MDAHDEETRQSNPSGDDTDNKNEIILESKDPSSTTTPTTITKTTASYDAYRKQYCLNYIRSFFNKHLDDSWFRLKYSPAVRCQYWLREQQRARHEAALLQRAARADPADFLRHVRLGHGSKRTTNNDMNNNNDTTIPPPRHHCLSLQQQQQPSDAMTTTALHVQEIPPHVTDEQLLLAMRDHFMQAVATASTASKKFVATDWHVWPASTIATAPLTALQRECIVVGPATAVADLWLALQQEPGSATAADANAAIPSAVPRKSGDWMDSNNHNNTNNYNNKTVVEMDVECSDHYGRLEYDADGRGGAPSDGRSVPIRKAVVTVQKLVAPPKTVTLSAALSSTRRTENDKEAAITMAQALDERKGIATSDGNNNTTDNDCCLQDILQPEWSASDMLDVAIAYLRRVHLVSFYNGCARAETVGDVLMGKSPVSTIHLRLANADDILTASDDNDEELQKDLLVRRLDDSIAKALEECESDQPGNCFIDEGMQATADAIASAEDQVQDRWLDDHAITDADGRARCSFRFCHKLFKDTTFLHKHLLKKHGEFLRAEQAKCHDAAMMRAWDESEDRPIPHIMVDCGAVLGGVSVPVTGGQIPDCVDPEPELWRRQEEARQRENAMKARRDELRQRQQVPRDTDDQQETSAPERPAFSRQPRGGFVDIDDMKEEKVELSFDNIPVPDATLLVKKKKKKRKLL